MPLEGTGRCVLRVICVTWIEKMKGLVVCDVCDMVRNGKGLVACDLCELIGKGQGLIFI